MKLSTTLAAAALLLFAGPLIAQDAGNVLVVTAGSGDYVLGAGGTLATLALEGYQVHIVQLGNDEKAATGLSPAEARWSNVEEAKQAAEFLGFRDTVYLGHKSGELGQVSSTEMRKQLFGLIRHFRPRKIFIPDPYVHYQPDRDQYWVGAVAEEAWGYSGGATFSPDLARMGLGPYGVPEVYYYVAGRPYRPGEGGERNARLIAVDIGPMFPAKVTALQMLRTRNRMQALHARRRLARAGRPAEVLDPGDDVAAKRLAEAFVEELARAVGRKHGFRYAEEFNYVGPGPVIPPHALERAIPK